MGPTGPRRLAVCTWCLVRVRRSQGCSASQRDGGRGWRVERGPSAAGSHSPGWRVERAQDDRASSAAVQSHQAEPKAIPAPPPGPPPAAPAVAALDQPAPPSGPPPPVQAPAASVSSTSASAVPPSVGAQHRSISEAVHDFARAHPVGGRDVSACFDAAVTRCGSVRPEPAGAPGLAVSAGPGGHRGA